MNECKDHLDHEFVIQKVRCWLQKAVIGLNLCPFAKSVFVKQQIRYVVSEARNVETLLIDLITQLQYLLTVDASLIDTTILIHPFVLENFLDYNDFLALADQVLMRQGWDGALQIASFHPAYQFADSAVDAIENYTNRSPFPILHLLREASIDQAVDAFPDAAEIYQKNIQTMRRLGLAGWEALFKADQADCAAYPQRKPCISPIIR